MSFVLNMCNYHYVKYLTTRRVKNFLIEHFGDKVCFTYPQNMRNSQMFFSASICSRGVFETLRSKAPIKLSAAKVRKECVKFDFLLDASYCNAQYVKVSLEQYKNNYVESWETFFNTLSPFRIKSRHIRRKTDIIFQIICNLIHTGKRKKPMQVALSEAIHSKCRSKKVTNNESPGSLHKLSGG